MKSTLLLILTLLAASLARANNIEVANVTLADQDTDNGTTQIRFDLSWENSWRISVGPANYDAAWIFVKYRVNNQPWRHATLSDNGTQATGGSQIDVVDNLGAFVYRAGDGSGDVSYDGLELRWDYGANSVDPNAIVDVQVFAIEMVYVPEGEFSVGTPFAGRNAINGEFYTRPVVLPAFVSPYSIGSEAAITVANTSGNLYYNVNEGLSAVNIGDQAGPIPAAFPKGFAAFYCMKYETSQEQWVAFFNTLTDNQKDNLDVTGPDGKNTDTEVARNGISWPDNGNATTSLPNVALNYVATPMTLAYLDWAGLRPLTELEYEKACRGPLAPQTSELAWGSASLHNSPYTLANAGSPDEVVSNPGIGTGNAAQSATGGSIGGPLRVGIFAASAINGTREESGGSYYGIMELSGNVYERAVTVGNPTGRAFTGAHGDGVLLNSGNHNVPAWPSTALGIGYRGGSHLNNLPFIAVSDRTDAASEITFGNSRLGFRGVRTAQ